MKFTGKTEIEATLNDTFAAIADFEMFENHARQSGAKVARVDDLTSPGPGMMWDIRTKIRDRNLRIQMELVDYDPPETLDFLGSTGGMDLALTIGLVPLTARRTRVAVTLDVKPRSLSARMLVQSARVTKGRLTRRYRDRIERFGQLLEARIRTS